MDDMGGGGGGLAGGWPRRMTNLAFGHNPNQDVASLEWASPRGYRPRRSPNPHVGTLITANSHRSPRPPLSARLVTKKPCPECQRVLGLCGSNPAPKEVQLGLLALSTWVY